ncbi:hypothetical protein ACFSKI_15670 [Pseudogracilibacillus auburnensis]|uniref:Uncharacterized protein n=1 Tax=Pseudogracilibacillus auburnensis TaxID=1494959 RepID=A0A2V3WLI1_9BACI|nr:hypothetical protein [Pseudogracilibacillus auburnensis]MBO1001483.1 hypothetical protein [Pseudogracilibacillus auburnensis]PXW89599.1 hypothetical protein DFR56_102377 [Pseudogracilibacillus auburnensis]
MSEQLKGSIYYLSSEIRYSLSVFWSILLSLLALSIFIDLLFKETNVVFTLAFPVYIYSAIAGQILVKSGVPYLIKMGSTRKNVFISFAVHFLGLAMVNAIIANTTYLIVQLIYKVVGVNEGTAILNTQPPPFGLNLFQDTWFTRFVIDSSICFILLVCSFILGLIFYRYGLIGGFSTIGVLLLLLIFGISNGWLIKLFLPIFADFNLSFFFQLFLFSILLYLFSYLLLRKFTIKG